MISEDLAIQLKVAGVIFAIALVVASALVFVFGLNAALWGASLVALLAWAAAAAACYAADTDLARSLVGPLAILVAALPTAVFLVLLAAKLAVKYGFPFLP